MDIEGLLKPLGPTSFKVHEQEPLLIRCLIKSNDLGRLLMIVKKDNKTLTISYYGQEDINHEIITKRLYDKKKKTMIEKMEEISQRFNGEIKYYLSNKKEPIIGFNRRLEFNIQSNKIRELSDYIARHSIGLINELPSDFCEEF